ncbi:MAG: hypothetical protein NWR96_02835 [Crocinitomicaceae bacterium]|jgi:hypothetical protein|nr:hypothetical protein [Crocinitomicaceae bacterium]MDP4760544.1 hypothetical protein [Crocinitomicaceae bacterium]
MSTFEFPQYRKLVNDKSFYRIEDERHFTEKQLIGKQVFTLVVEAKQYPEIMRIQDMLQCTEGFVLSDREAYDGL